MSPAMWQDLLAYLGSAALIVSAFAWIGRKAIDQWLSQRLESHKSALDQASQRALEQAKSELRVQELRASHIVDQQADILAELFARLEQLHAALAALSKPRLHEGGRAPALRDVAVAKLDELEAYYYPRAIWLERGTCDALNALIELLRSLIAQLSSNLSATGIVVDRPRWVETYDRINEEIPVARRALDEEFRRVLGIAIGSRS